MTPAKSLDEVVALYERWGDDHYDEEISQLAHAEQTAAHAVDAGVSDQLVAAALLHDVGHLLALDSGEDDKHQVSGPAWLAGLFPSTVVRPIALHVDAKRFLCAVDPAYHSGLSAGSVASLVRQGGFMSPDQAAAFAAEPGSDDAVLLRHWDDLGKVDGLAVAPFASHAELLARVIEAGEPPRRRQPRPAKASNRPGRKRPRR
jgi:predicted HD phosphohydrolase